MREMWMAGAVAAAVGLGALAAVAGTIGGLAVQTKVGMICAGSTVDGGWNQQAKTALEAAEKSVGATGTIVEQVKEDRAADALRDFSRRGADVVICHGFEFLGPAEKVAKAEKKMKIAVSGADTGKGYDDVLMMEIDISGPSYQLGVMAGKVSKSGKLGFIAGSEIPPVDAAFKAFEAGAKSVNANAEVVKAYTSWDEPLKSKQQAEAFFERGVDVIYQDLDTASKGVFEAVAARNDGPQRELRNLVYVFGCNSDQNGNSICPNYTLASAVIRLDLAFAGVVKSVKEGTFKPGVHVLDIKNGETACVVNPKVVGGVVTKEIVAAVEEAGKKLTR